MFFLFGVVSRSENLFKSFGFEKESVFLGFMLFQFVFSPIDKTTSFMMNYLSRKYEFEADNVSKELGYKEELKSGLIKIHTKNMGNLNRDKWFSTYHYTHPSLVERLQAIDE
jgi:STE24 endopeptidase